jgi:hypothetical protein
MLNELLLRTDEHRSVSPYCNGDAESGYYSVRCVFFTGSCTKSLGSKSLRASRLQCAIEHRQKEQESINGQIVADNKCRYLVADARRNFIIVCCGKSKCNNVTKSTSSSPSMSTNMQKTNSLSTQRTAAATAGDSNGSFQECIDQKCFTEVLTMR